MQQMIDDLDKQIQGQYVEPRVDNTLKKPKVHSQPESYRSNQSPQRYRLLKKVQKKKLTPEEFREQAIFEIFSFYSRQHIKKGVDFVKFQEQQKMDKGELSAFCRDFGFYLSKSKIVEIFKQVSKEQTSLNLEQFEHALPIIAIEYSKEKTRELKARLKQIKNTLEYPDNTPDNRPVQEIINTIEQIHLDPVNYVRNKE